MPCRTRAAGHRRAGPVLERGRRSGQRSARGFAVAAGTASMRVGRLDPLRVIGRRRAWRSHTGLPRPPRAAARLGPPAVRSPGRPGRGAVALPHGCPPVPGPDPRQDAIPPVPGAPLGVRGEPSRPQPCRPALDGRSGSQGSRSPAVLGRPPHAACVPALLRFPAFAGFGSHGCDRGYVDACGPAAGLVWQCGRKRRLICLLAFG